MRIVGVTVARNEEDIVEASIRHNLRQVDALVVVDHASTDATSAILASLAGEGLPVGVTRDDTLGALSPSFEAELVRRVIEGGADLCIPLGADEFLRVPSRETFERAVQDAGAAGIGIVVQTFAPAFTDEDIVARLRRAKRRPAEPAGSDRLVATRRAPVGQGPGDARATLPASIAAIARVPVRGVEQHVARTAIGYLSRLIATPPVDDASNPFREAYTEIVSGRVPTRERLDSVVERFGLPADRHPAAGAAGWVDDPFVADVELRYTPDRPTAPLARVLAFGERVAEEVARTTGGL